MTKTTGHLFTSSRSEAATPVEYDEQFRRGLAGGNRVARTREAASERAAIESALAELRPGDLVVLG